MVAQPNDYVHPQPSLSPLDKQDLSRLRYSHGRQRITLARRLTERVAERYRLAGLAQHIGSGLFAGILRETAQMLAIRVGDVMRENPPDTYWEISEDERIEAVYRECGV